MARSSLLIMARRGVEVVDVASLRCVSSIQDTHARPAHTVVQSACASLFVSHPREALELFATAAPDSTVKL